MVPGERVPPTDIEGVRVGVTTCYDLRFPEQFRQMVEAGVERAGAAEPAVPARGTLADARPGAGDRKFDVRRSGQRERHI